MGLRHENVILCDTKGVVYRGRTEGMNQWKSAPRGRDQGAHARRRDQGRRRLVRPFRQGRVDAGDGASRWRRSPSSSPWPIPIRRSRPRKSPPVRDDAIVATGRSDYPNQVNNVLGFPYIFRGALDVRATTINEEMKIAAAKALAELAREDVPDEVAAAYRRAAGLWPRLHHPGAVRSAADIRDAAGGGEGGDGLGRRAEADRRHGRLCARSFRARLDPVAGVLSARVRAAAPAAQARGVRRGRGGAGHPRRGELRAARAWARAILVGREDRVQRGRDHAGVDLHEGIEIHNARLSKRNIDYAELSLRAAAAARASSSATASAW